VYTAPVEAGLCEGGVLEASTPEELLMGDLPCELIGGGGG